MDEKNNTSSETQERFAKNKARLCMALRITRPTLDAWLKLPDAPRRRPNGQYQIEEWLAFASTRKVETDAGEAAKLKLKKLRQDVELGQIKILKESGDLVPVEWAKQLVAHLAISVRNIIQSCDITPEQKLTITEKVEKIDFENYLSQLRVQAEEDMVEESGDTQKRVEQSQAD